MAEGIRLQKDMDSKLANKAYHLNFVGSLAPLTQTIPTLSYFVSYKGKDIECSPKGILHVVKKTTWICQHAIS
jgi:hypothetical protein